MKTEFEEKAEELEIGCNGAFILRQAKNESILIPAAKLERLRKILKSI